jgi:hypothetical protein
VKEALGEELQGRKASIITSIAVGEVCADIETDAITTQVAGTIGIRIGMENDGSVSPLVVIRGLHI